MGLFSRDKSTDTSAVSVTEALPTAVEDISGTYAIDPTHSSIGFTARHAMVTKVRGVFQEFDGSATIDTANIAASSVTVSIKTASVFTNQAQRDEHLRNSDFFEAATYPSITFVSTEVAQGADGEFLVTGDLTIKGATRSLTIPFEQTGTAVDPYGNLRAGFEGAVVVNRKDWGLDWNAALETGGVLVSEKVTLEFDISAIRA